MEEWAQFGSPGEDGDGHLDIFSAHIVHSISSGPVYFFFRLTSSFNSCCRKFRD